MSDGSKDWIRRGEFKKCILAKVKERVCVGVRVYLWYCTIKGGDLAYLCCVLCSGTMRFTGRGGKKKKLWSTVVVVLLFPSLAE